MNKAEKLTQYYRWRFLRLNKGYQRDSNLFAKGVKAISGNQKVSKEERQERIEQLENKLYMRYGINGIYDYRIQKPPATLQIYGENEFAVQKGTLSGIFGSELKDNQEISGNHLLETIYRKKVLIDKKGNTVENDVPLITPKYVQVVINYDAKLGDIRSQISKIIKHTQRLRKNEFDIKKPTTTSIEFSKVYDKYLRIWALHVNKVRNKTIAKRVFPGMESRDAEDKVIKYRTNAAALINGEYRMISF